MYVVPSGTMWQLGAFAPAEIGEDSIMPNILGGPEAQERFAEKIRWKNSLKNSLALFLSSPDYDTQIRSAEPWDLCVASVLRRNLGHRHRLSPLQTTRERHGTPTHVGKPQGQVQRGDSLKRCRVLCLVSPFCDVAFSVMLCFILLWNCGLLSVCTMPLQITA